MIELDVIIIGAGAAGLACARELSGAGKRLCIVEARDRAGGRIDTHHIDGVGIPIELGAEFIHGEVEETFSIVDAAALLVYELPNDHWSVRDGKWERLENFWQTASDVFALGIIQTLCDRIAADDVEIVRLRQEIEAFQRGDLERRLA